MPTPRSREASFSHCQRRQGLLSIAFGAGPCSSKQMDLMFHGLVEPRLLWNDQLGDVEVSRLESAREAHRTCPQVPGAEAQPFWKRGV